jgi:hypothetical protein
VVRYSASLSSSTDSDTIPNAFRSPGRFFAANELKALLAHIVFKYEVKLENEGERPEDMWLVYNCVPNPKARVMFRARLG